jgi:NAD+ diphosphatase
MNSSVRSADNTFAALGMDRCAERRDDSVWISERVHAATARYLVLRADGSALLSGDQRRLLHLDTAARQQIAPEASPTLLGCVDGTDHFAVSLDDAAAARVAAAAGGGFLDLRSAGALLPAFEAGLFAYARGLAHWQQRTRFCTCCAAPLMLQAAGHRAKCTNTQCATEHFPRTDPAIIVIVSHGDRCLLGRGPQWPERRYSTLAGFVEPGESLEDAVRREVFEEAGVRVGPCDYHSSQPWPFPASIMLGFTAIAEDPTIRLGAELAEARWFSVEELTAGLRSGALKVSSRLSVSYKLIEHWLRQTAGIELSSLTAGERLPPATRIVTTG